MFNVWIPFLRCRVDLWGLSSEKTQCREKEQHDWPVSRPQPRFPHLHAGLLVRTGSSAVAGRLCAARGTVQPACRGTSSLAGVVCCSAFCRALVNVLVSSEACGEGGLFVSNGLCSVPLWTFTVKGHQTPCSGPSDRARGQSVSLGRMAVLNTCLAFLLAFPSLDDRNVRWRGTVAQACKEEGAGGVVRASLSRHTAGGVSHVYWEGGGEAK